MALLLAIFFRKLMTLAELPLCFIRFLSSCVSILLTDWSLVTGHLVFGIGFQSDSYPPGAEQKAND